MLGGKSRKKNVSYATVAWPTQLNIGKADTMPSRLQMDGVVLLAMIWRLYRPE
jgi:hypothetical protein